MAHAEGSAAVVAGACGDDDETGQQQQQQQKEPGHPPVKRVRFDQGYELPSNQDKAECRQFDTTDGTKSALDGLDSDDEGDACISDDAAAAAARKRRSMRWHVAGSAGLALLEELEAAEEDYDEPEELFNANGVPIEPFHLRAERAEGFFDEEGNYVLRRGPRPMRDAWLDSLQDAPVELSPALAARLAARLAEAERSDALQDDGGSGTPLHEDDAAIMRKRIADLLLPGENVLGALRRLATPATYSSSRAAAAAAAAADAGVSSSAGKRQRQQQRHQRSAALQGEQTTAQGSQGAHLTQPRAQMSGGESGTARLQKAPPSACDGEQQQQHLHPPQQADEGTRSWDQRLWHREQVEQQARSEAAAAALVARRARVPSEHRAAFDRLTDYADTLLAAGDDVYNCPREALLASLDQPGLALLLGESQHSQSPGTGPAAINGGVGAAIAAAAAAAAAPLHLAEEEVEDMFANDDASGDSAKCADDDDGDVPPGCITNSAAVDGKEVGGTAPPPAAAAAAAGSAAAAAAAAAAAGGVSPDDSQAAMLDGLGFVRQPGGCYYSSTLGYYFEPRTSLFGDAGSGLWYRYDEASGTYTLATAAALS